MVGDNGDDSSRSIAEALHAGLDWCFNKLAWLPVTLVIVLNGLGGLFAILAGFAPVKDRPVNVAIAVAAVVLAGILSALIERERRHSESVRTREGATAQLAVTEAVLPVLALVGKMASEPSNRRAVPFEKTVSHVLQSKAVLFPGVKDVRMVVYRVEIDGPRKRLVVEDSAGRRRDKPEPFVAGDGGRGDAAFEWLSGGKPKFVPNTAAEYDKAWKGSGRGYRTYISVPILVKDEAFGMLTVDAPTPGDLDETDVPLVEVLAGLLAVGYRLRSR
ncbi:GAF domain-containing protein [Microbacterium jejuense]|uniref:GAF domain-containing protein n=1 Tax=Microbacterium jejuense TaxID=1263637 RepID=A0ABS7HJG3_9MICO|nr:GAF domain-containing protein [Microbacterium jejuense]MBW9093091.1 GAF domain-containing protein [Microbacterium jejuense]